MIQIVYIMCIKLLYFFHLGTWDNKKPVLYVWLVDPKIACCFFIYIRKLNGSYDVPINANLGLTFLLVALLYFDADLYMKYRGLFALHSIDLLFGKAYDLSSSQFLCQILLSPNLTSWKCRTWVNRFVDGSSWKENPGPKISPQTFLSICSLHLQGYYLFLFIDPLTSFPPSSLNCSWEVRVSCFGSSFSVCFASVTTSRDWLNFEFFYFLFLCFK